MPETTTVNFFFQGTGEHREKIGKDGHVPNSLLTNFFNSCQTDDHNFAHLFDGPGGKSANADTEHPTPGQYIYQADEHEPGKGKKIPHKDMPDKMKVILGNLFGLGVDDNVAEAIEYLQQLIRLDKKPDTINLYGFSRGAYTCLIVANVIYQMYPEIKVNFALYDPVPGPGLKSDTLATVIPPNVERALIVYQMHEEGLLFEAQSLNRLRVVDPKKTKLEVETMIGGHNAGIRYRENHNEPARLVGAISLDFAQKSGTQFKETPLIAQYPRKNMEAQDSKPQQQLQLYFDMKNKSKIYAKQAKSQLFKRDFTKEMEYYVQDPEFFVSKRHRELFKKILPLTFDYFFQKGIEGTTDPYKVYEEIKNNLADYPQLQKTIFAALQSWTVDHASEKVLIDSLLLPAEPTGHRIKEKMIVLEDQPLANDELLYLTDSVRMATDYAQLKYFAGTHFSLTKEAKKLRETVLSISQDEQLDESQKIKKIKMAILDCTDQLDQKNASRFLLQLKGMVNDADAYYLRLERIATDPTTPKLLQDINQNSALNDAEKIQAMTALMNDRYAHNPQYQQLNKQSTIDTNKALIQKTIDRIQRYVLLSKVKMLFSYAKEKVFGKREDIANKYKSIRILENALVQLQMLKQNASIESPKEAIITHLQTAIAERQKVEETPNFRSPSIEMLTKCIEFLSPVRGNEPEEELSDDTSFASRP